MFFVYKVPYDNINIDFANRLHGKQHELKQHKISTMNKENQFLKARTCKNSVFRSVR